MLISLPLFVLPSRLNAQDRRVFFDVDAAGADKSLPTWGLDTAWLDAANVIRGVEFMGKPQVDVIRFSFTPDRPLVDGDLNASAQEEFDQRMAIVDNYTEADTALYFNVDGAIDPYFKDANDETRADRWAQLIDVTRQKCEAAGRTVLSVAPFNEPDYTTEQGDISKLHEICTLLRNDAAYAAAFQDIRLYGASTLNADEAANWYTPLASVLDEGNTHQLAGSFDSYADFYELVQSKGDLGANDELHNVMEAIVGAEYGMDAAIWWGTAEYARGEFVQASDGPRLGYAEHRPNWTAAAVYRAPDGEVKAFVGASERQATTTTYQFVSRDRDVYFDGIGPQRAYTVEVPGGNGYWVDQPNAEAVVNVTWGEDIPHPVDGRYQLVNRLTGKVMEVADDSMADGANVQLGVLSEDSAQQWRRVTRWS
ncbi:MAG: Ricin-type beta-trefoil lectin domain protein [Puniceicoccaceae bacterium 5H]|nr:MAG: Ricin-type beta-trefoil lectin domain protein [Puniceicoccaceae bacterium 5H]